MKNSFLIKIVGWVVLSLLVTLLVQQKPLVASVLKIHVWYGTNQSFGQPGLAQRWVNVLGNVQPDTIIQTYSLNGGSPHVLSTGEDGRRLALDGDFNIDIHEDSLREGSNVLRITAVDSAGRQVDETVNIQFTRANQWSLPYAVNWDTVENISDVVQIVDGKWKLVEGGVRTKEPYYDRVLAFGDTSWHNYEVSTSVIFHNFTLPRPGPPTFNVSHAAIATRWPGHDFDGKQPHAKWFPLGATAEFRLTDNLDSCRWRVFDGEHLYVEDANKIRSIELEEKYHMKHRVLTIHDSLTRYQVKLWQDGTKEPDNWDLVAEEFTPDNISSGSALLLAHNTDVTFGSFSVIAIDDE
ncbi:MAG: hypothetical protein WBA23_13670 [Tunicatimonas sp.]|uniref:hypothetical protein n=1 Tax=Tunicatimonas sp. TaxID=1940096 RepID=UPI003C758644